MDNKQNERIKIELPEDMHFSPEEGAAIEQLNKIIRYDKGTTLVREGEVSTISFHIVKGCVRQFYLTDGEEKTTNFYTENQSINPASSITDLHPSKHYLECIEETYITAISPEQEQELYTKFPRIESLCRLHTERALGEQQEAFARFIMSSPEERYLNILSNRPDLINRVPQYQLASFLGMKPESLSRIRKRIKDKFSSSTIW